MKWMEEQKKHCCLHKLMYRINENAKRKGTFYGVVIHHGAICRV